VPSVSCRWESTSPTGNFSCELPTDPTHLRSVRRMVRDWAAAAGMHGDRLDDLVLAVDEAASSGIEHSGDRRGPVWVDGHVAFGQVRIVVTDYGRRGSSTASRRFGLRMIGDLTDHVHAEDCDGATAITMVWDMAGTRSSRDRYPSTTGSSK